MKIVAIVMVLSLFTTLVPGSTMTEQSIRVFALPSSPFSTPVIVNDNKANDQVAPAIVGLPGYGLFVVWQDFRAGDWDIYTSTSNNNGTSYTVNKRADDSTDMSRQIEPAVAVMKNGTILLTWQDNRRSTIDYDIYFAKSYDGGATFTSNVRVDDSNGKISWQERPAIAVTDGGAIYIAWTDDRTLPFRVRGAFSTDGGATFSPSEEIAPSTHSSGETGIGLVSNGERIFATFMDNVTGTPHPYICVSTDGGQSFSAPTRLDKAGSAVSQKGISIAATPSGGVAVVWGDSRNGNEDIYARMTCADGTPFGPDYRVDDDSSGSYQYDASVALDSAGAIYVVWEDERDSIYAIRFAYMNAGGTKFNASLQVSPPRVDAIQRRASIITTDPGHVMIAWQDDKANTDDIYTSSGYFPSVFELNLAQGWNFVSIPPVSQSYKASTLGLLPGDVVTGYNSATQTYNRSYTVGSSPPFKDFSILPNEGYWIFAGGARTLYLRSSEQTGTQTKAVTVPSGGGGVIFGLASLKTKYKASGVPAWYTGGNITLVASYDAASGTYRTWTPGSPPFKNFFLMPGQAYWICVTASGTLSYNP